MTIDVLNRSIIGVEREIAERRDLLATLKSWATTWEKSAARYSWHYFYVAGPRAVRELTVLQSICEDLKKILDQRLEETP